MSAVDAVDDQEFFARVRVLMGLERDEFVRVNAAGFAAALRKLPVSVRAPIVHLALELASAPPLNVERALRRSVASDAAAGGEDMRRAFEALEKEKG